MLALKETTSKMAAAKPRSDGKRVDVRAAVKDIMKKYPNTMAYLAK